jgi:very-short-patch-repair endonuclease
MPHSEVASRSRNNAKSMRRAMTAAELKFWNAVRAHRLEGLGFRRQLPIGRYIVDFACPAHRLIVELDGVQHADAEHRDADDRRSAYLATLGWQMQRFWNDDVLRDVDGVCAHILAVISENASVTGDKP